MNPHPSYKEQGQTHVLEEADPLFQDVYTRRKTFIVTKDLGFRVGDIIKLKRVDQGIVTGEVIDTRITYLQLLKDIEGCSAGEGYVIAAIKARAFYWEELQKDEKDKGQEEIEQLALHDLIPAR